MWVRVPPRAQRSETYRDPLTERYSSKVKYEKSVRLLSCFLLNDRHLLVRHHDLAFEAGKHLTLLEYGTASKNIFSIVPNVDIGRLDVYRLLTKQSSLESTVSINFILDLSLHADLIKVDTVDDGSDLFNQVFFSHLSTLTGMVTIFTASVIYISVRIAF